MTATQVLIIAAVFSVAVAAPEIAAELDTDPSRIGIFTGIVFAISVISTVAGGNATALLGGVRVSQVCLVFAGLAMLSAVLDEWWGLALAAVLLGLAMGPETPASSHLLSRAVPQAQQTWIFSVRQTGNQIGGIVASLLVPAVAAAYGWRASLGLLAAGCAIYAVLLEVERRALRAVDVPDPSERRTAIADSLRLVLHDRRLRRLALAAFTFCGMQVCHNGFFVSYEVTHLAMDLLAAGWRGESWRTGSARCGPFFKGLALR